MRVTVGTKSKDQVDVKWINSLQAHRLRTTLSTPYITPYSTPHLFASYDMHRCIRTVPLRVALRVPLKVPAGTSGLHCADCTLYAAAALWQVARWLDTMSRARGV